MRMVSIACILEQEEPKPVYTPLMCISYTHKVDSQRFKLFPANREIIFNTGYAVLATFLTAVAKWSHKAIYGGKGLFWLRVRRDSGDDGGERWAGMRDRGHEASTVKQRLMHAGNDGVQLTSPISLFI